MNHLWVVEMFLNGKWEPTTSVALTRDEVWNERADILERNPHDRFRIRKYITEKRDSA